MSVRPVAFHPDGSVDVWHDDYDHGGTLAPAAVAFQTVPGGHDHRYIVLPCPVAGCPAPLGSTHPIGGGADAAQVQELFVRLAARVGCACGQVTSGKPLPIVQAHIKLLAERQDFVGRWAAGVLH